MHTNYEDTNSDCEKIALNIDTNVVDVKNSEQSSKILSSVSGTNIQDVGELHNNDDFTPTNKSLFKMPLLAAKLPEKKLVAFSGATDSEFPAKSRHSKKNVEAKCETKVSSLKNAGPSPTEKLKELPIPYKEPDWGGPSEVLYSFEVLKKGVIIEDIDLTTKSFHVFGRLPSCDVTMEHPSLSRYHAVVQHCSIPNEKHSVGWYLYDLDSTHGTWINKIKVKPNTFYKLKVGHVVKFGGSTRLHILQVITFILSGC